MPRLAALLLSLAALPALAATAEEDLQQYLAIFQHPSKIADDAVDDLGWKGISDPRLFDKIEELLLVGSRGIDRRDRVGRNHIGRLIKALGFSGQAKYQATLGLYAVEYRVAAERALINLKLYERWNPVISDRAQWDPKYSDDVNRVRIMLRSDDVLLETLGAKRVFYAQFNEPLLLDMVAERLRACYRTVNNPDTNGLDAAGWMVNALGKSNDAKHRALLEEVAAGAVNLALSTRAQKNLRR